MKRLRILHVNKRLTVFIGAVFFLLLCVVVKHPKLSSSSSADKKGGGGYRGIIPPLRDLISFPSAFSASKSSSTSTNSQKKAGGGVADLEDTWITATAAPTALQRPPLRRRVNDNDTIYVSIASFRDEQCHKTIWDMYDKAALPSGIYVGAVEQHFDNDTNCMPPEFTTDACQLLPFCPSDNIRVRRIDPRMAKGPTFGRYIGALMYSGQAFYMMIDSHMRFPTHWDVVARRQYRNILVDYAPTVTKPVISHYPLAWVNPKTDPKRAAGWEKSLENRTKMSYTCSAKFMTVKNHSATRAGLLRLDGLLVPLNGKKAWPQPWAAAGFLFADASILQEVPFDPNLYYVFDGEEIMYSVRLWTHGWDIFCPSENIVFHEYKRPKAPKFWKYANEKTNQQTKSRAERRIQRMLKALHRENHTRIVPDDDPDPLVHADADKYGLGTTRTLDQYYAYAGADRMTYNVDYGKKFCHRYPKHPPRSLADLGLPR